LAVIVIAGPTASGKTAAAIALAQRLGTEIISADSRQCFRELNIGVAKPSAAELQTVPHHFINSHSITQEVNAAAFEQYALQVAQSLLRKYKTAVLVGGTGLYIKAFCEGIDNIPPIPEEYREAIIQQYEQEGLPWLQQMIRQHDPDYVAVGEMQNPQRLMRALEVKLATGQSIRSFQQGRQLQRPFRIIKAGIDLPKAILHQRIHNRVDAMMEAGLEAEARALLPQRHLNALQTVGYTELFDYFDGKIPRSEAVALIKTHTRQYAKRQLTWFRKDKEIQWMSAEAVAEMKPD
jgi:tRNA dimethylallyltransferase